MTAEDVMTVEGPGTTNLRRRTEKGTERGIRTGIRIDEPLMMDLGDPQKARLPAAPQSSHGRGARSNGQEPSRHIHRHFHNHTTSLMGKPMGKLLVNGSRRRFQHGIPSNGRGYLRLLPRGSGRRHLSSGLQQHLISNGHNTRRSSGDP